MGKKGKNKNGTIVVESTPKVETNEKDDKESKKEPLIVELPKIEEITKTPDAAVEVNDKNEIENDGTLKSKKKRNRKKKNTITDTQANDVEVEKSKQQIEVKPQEVEKIEPKPTESTQNEASSETLKRKRKRNKKKNQSNVNGEQEEEDGDGDAVEKKIQEVIQVAVKEEVKKEESVPNNDQDTLKKRKRNKNKKKGAANAAEADDNETTEEKPQEIKEEVKNEAKAEEKVEPQKKNNKKQKRSDLSSKKTITDELQERQDREQKEARDHLKNEIAKREKLLETIDLVLDCHKSEVELAQSQQDSLKDISSLTSQMKATPTPAPPPPPSPKKTPSPLEEQLADKIEQVLGVTKLEIKNVQNQQAFVGRLETELAKVKQNKDRLLRGDTSESSAIPPKIQQMTKNMHDLTKGELPKSKKELIKEIETRDVLMSEINKVLDTTKTEIEKVQKQQKIITNLEVELNKMKEQDMAEKLMALAEEEEEAAAAAAMQPIPTAPKVSSSTASLLDALMANVGKLKEAQALKEKQKAEEEAKTEVSEKVKESPALKEEMKEEKPVEKEKVEEPSKIEKKDKSKSPPKDVKKSPESKKSSKDQKKSSAKGPEKKTAEVIPKVENKIEKVEEIIEPKVEAKPEETKQQNIVVEEKDTKIKEKPSETQKIVNKPETQKNESKPKAESKPETQKNEPKPKAESKPETPKVGEKQETQKNEPKPKAESKPETPKVEKKLETPKVEAKPETPKVEKKLETPKVEAKQETPKAETKTEVPKVKKKSETPKVESKPESPKVELKTETPKVETKPDEVKPIASSEPAAKKESPKPAEKGKNNNQKSSPKANDSKKGNKKESAKDAAKKKQDSQQNKKDTDDDSEKSSQDVVTNNLSTPPNNAAVQKLSMAEMLKNAPDPPIEEIAKKLNDEAKIEQAPLARPESAIIEVTTVEQIKEVPEKIEEIKAEVPKKEEILEKIEALPIEANVVDDNKLDDSLVIVNKADIENEMKSELEEDNRNDSKNVQGGGFVSPAKSSEQSDAKPLRKDDKPQATKARSPVKTPTKQVPPKVGNSKPAQSKAPAKPKVEQPKAPAKTSTSNDLKKPVDPKPAAAPVPTENVQQKVEVAAKNNNENSTPLPPSTTSPKVVDNTSQESAPEKPKVPPKTEATKNNSNNSKPVSSSTAKAGNVTTTQSNATPTKSNTPSPSKPSVTKAPPSQPQTSTAKPKSATAPPPKQSTTNSKPSTNTKPTNPKSNTATTQKTSSTKQQAPKPSSTFDSVSRLREMNQQNDNDNYTSLFSQPAFSIRMDEKSNPNKCPSFHPENNNNQMKAMLTNDGTIKIILPPSTLRNPEENSKDLSILSKDYSISSSKNTISKCNSSKSTNESINLMKTIIDDENDDDDRYLQYKMQPRQIFCCSVCHVCKVNLSRYFLCKECKMISYCKEEHMKIDYLNHKDLCMAIQLIAKRRGGHVYNLSKHLTSIEFRNLRIHTISLCQQFLDRTLTTYERELFLFPRLCHEASCREWKSNLLNDCEKCGLVSYCTMHPLSETHKMFCSSYALFQRIVLHEKSYGRINISLPQKVLKKVPCLTEDVYDTMRLLYKNITAFQDESVMAALMMCATAPLTTFYAYQKTGLEVKEQMIFHFVGAELQFEGDNLEKWESLFLHLFHGVTDLQIVFIGAELNVENLPVEIISRTRMCKTCRTNCCGIRFDFQCKKFYHDYCESKAYTRPDLICFLNAAVHRPGFQGFDTWEKTIEAAHRSSVPILVTTMSENDCYNDLDRFKKITNNDIDIYVPPIKNPYASTRPDRNFSSDDDVPIIFKNNYMFVVSKAQDLIEF